MFFFFAGGVSQQVRQILKAKAGRCINCGSAADLVEYDKVLKLFFIPVYKWPGKQPMMNCNNCNLFYPPQFSLPPPPPPEPTTKDDVVSTSRCRFCHSLVDADFNYCPYCGSHMIHSGRGGICVETSWPDQVFASLESFKNCDAFR
ncbi:hypothetical protein ACFE04_012044 [Oxalis oulophora]